MNTTSTVKVRWLQKPQVKRVKVTQWHCVLLISALLKVESLELRNLSRALRLADLHP